MEQYQNISTEAVENLLGSFPAEFMNLSKEQKLISSKIYNLLSEGDPVSVEEIARSLDLETDNVKRITDELPGIYYNDDGNIIGFGGLTVVEMGHKFKLGEKTLYGWCAWDTLFIPQLIDKTIRVESTDPNTKATISLTVTPNSGILGIEPEEAVTSFLIPDNEISSEMKADVINSFCHYLHFFESQKSAEEWVSQSDKKDELVILPIEDAYSIGLRKNEIQFGELLETA